ncbi:MAG: hypothetical protein KIT72_15195 [Polyangiaceae bacterium]|nr:hypothetical protein [Polyangiaceae bacterium]MCW5791761.1 hypothetical protein [Polyangiaceae bacterium]
MTLKYVSVLGLLGCVACGGSASVDPKTPDKDSGQRDQGGQAVSEAAAAGFQRALDKFVANDRSGNWTEASCSSVGAEFLAAAEEQRKSSGKALPEALYNAGLAFARCGQDEKAKKHFQEAASASSDFHRARGQLALYEYQTTKNIDATIEKLEQIIRDAKFQNVEALVSVAALQLERGNEVANADGKNDLERAKLNIQRALAIDDSFMPAFNQLAIYYLELAKRSAEGAKKQGKQRRSLVVASDQGVDVNRQQLDLAALVASQAIRKNPKYAPIHNTAGLIQVQLRDYNGAVQSFKRARSLDPKFFEAHMNYAAVNLSFRGFSEAEQAYRDAIKLQPKTFEAHLGLALALRGQINDANFDKNVAEAQKHLDEARKIAPDRAETYYNEAILTQEYKAKGDEKNSIPMLKKAASIYDTFVSKAGSDAAFASAVKIAKDRSTDISDTIKFIEDGKKAQDDMPPPPAGE